MPKNAYGVWLSIDRRTDWWITEYPCNDELEMNLDLRCIDLDKLLFT